MKLYSKYISFYLAKFFLINILVLIALALSIKLLSLISINMLSGADNLLIALKIALISIPTLLLYLAPISLLCTILYTYYTLYVDSEIIVLESIGLSKVDIAKPAARFAIIVTFICYFLTFFGVPEAKKQLSNYIDFIKNNIEISSIIEEKTFTRISKNMTLYVNNKGQNNIFNGIALYNKEYNGSTTFILAEKAELVDSEGKIFFRLFNGNRQSINNANLQILYFNELKFEIPKKPLMRPTNKKLVLEEQDIFSLLTKNYNSTTINNIIAELNQRLVWPLLNLSIAGIGISASFSRFFSRNWNVYKLIYAAAASIILFGVVILSSRKASDSIFFTSLMYIAPLCACFISFSLIKSYAENRLSTYTILKKALGFNKKTAPKV